MNKADEKVLSVKLFLLKILIWLPITFIAWYFITPVLIYIIAFLSKAILSFVASSSVVDVDPVGHVLHIVTPFASSAPTEENQGQLVFVINAMKYGYGIALFIAMLLATPDKINNKLQNIYIGVLILILVQTWGVTFDTLQTLLFKFGREIGETLNTTAFTREVIALCYQLGYLILPAVTPILLWFTMYQEHLAKIAPRFAKPRKTKLE